VQTVRKQILDDHSQTIAAVIDTATAVATAIEEWPVSNPNRIRLPLERLLGDRELLEPLLGLLDTAADTLETAIQGQPVASPPYLAVTSRGVVCRGTLSDGRRLVIELILFEVETRPRRYRFSSPTASECLQVQLH